LLKGEHDIKLIMAITTIAVGTGGAVAFMPYLRLSVFFNLSIFMPAGFLMLYYHDSPLLAVSIILFSIYMIFISYRGSNEYWEALENEFLLEKKSADLEKLSRTDVLTGLYNRRYFDEVFDYEWKRVIRNSSTICIMICDIDHFKQVNDTYGHLAGDEFLKMTADILNKVLKRKTDILARYGGEEFVVLISDTDLDKAYKLADKLRTEIEKCSLEYNKKSIKTTMSIGISSLTPCCDDTKDNLIYKADSALYDAKKEGRNRVKTNKKQCSKV
ncbi:GGDEF domain-containing protein, partial [Desulfobacterales bacterium HSG17]|nr:GGDEF domain-containing protein [Desulfobacterales bacterium HSG17]